MTRVSGGILRTFACLILFCATSAFGLTIRSMSDLTELQNRVFSDPIGVAQDVEAFLKGANPKSNLELWTTALTMHLVLVQGDFDAPESEALQSNWVEQTLPLFDNEPESAIKLAFQSQVLFRKVRKSGATLNLDTIGREFKSLAEQAKRRGDHLTAASILSEYMFFLNSRQQSLSALEYAQHTLTELGADNSQDKAFNKAEIQSNIAVFYLNEGKLDDALRLWLEIHNTACKNQKNLYFCNPILTNIAGVYIKKETAVDIVLALPFLEQAFVDAKSINDVSTLAHAHYKRAFIHVRQEQWAKALRDYEEARDLYQKLDSPHWMIKILIGIAKVKNRLGRFEEARRELDEARSLLTPDARSLHPDLDEAAIENLKGLKQFEEALALMTRRFNELQIEYRTKSDQSYSESMANVGLQIEKERNKVLERDKEIVQLKLETTQEFQKYLLMGIALSFLIVLASLWMIYQNRLIRRFKVELQRVLDTIEEAIFAIDSDLQIQGPASKYLEKLRPDRSIEVGQKFIEAVLQGSLLTDDQIQVVRESLAAMLNEDKLAWELNEAHLPLEIIFRFQQKDHVLSIHWQPLWNAGMKLQGFMVSMRDITERRNIEKTIHQERLENRTASECLLELARANVARVRKLLDQVTKFLDGNINTQDQAIMRREIHTIKGIARTLGLRVMSQGVHQLEDSQQITQEALDQLKPVIGIYRNILNQLEGSGHDRKSADIVDLNGLWSSIMPDLLKRLEKAELEYAGTMISDRVGIWPAEILEKVEHCLLHAINNSVDHGFIRPRQHQKMVDAPYFEVEARRDGNKFWVLFRDNGHGIDFEQLALLAAKREKSWTTSDELLELIFADGATTALELSETSGRGVGMAAIRSLCRESGGDARITPRKDQSGAELIMSFGATMPFPKVASFP